ncbi:MAG: HD domain-containing protein [Pirellulaceae bacterium]|nr:HD domain-containing protein [Pirellulaceae bacterium]
MSSVEEIVNLLESRGDSQYGGEAVTQLEHALQAATLAEREQADAALISAALLHDIGHLLHNLPDHAPDDGVDDHHETSAGNFLRQHFPPAVTEPVRLHVAAKRYLCAVQPGYFEQLSQPSVVSLKLQGGPMSPEEVAVFKRLEFAEDAVRLRKWDDEAKIPEFATPGVRHFERYLRESMLKVSR